MMPGGEVVGARACHGHTPFPCWQRVWVSDRLRSATTCGVMCLPGKVVRVLVGEGELATAGEPVVILEVAVRAMA